MQSSTPLFPYNTLLCSNVLLSSQNPSVSLFLLICTPFYPNKFYTYSSIFIHLFLSMLFSVFLKCLPQSSSCSFIDILCSLRPSLKNKQWSSQIREKQTVKLPSPVQSPLSPSVSLKRTNIMWYWEESFMVSVTVRYVVLLLLVDTICSIAGTFF